MQVKTSIHINASKAKIWPLLFGSKMDDKHPCRTLMGLPKPVECKLEDNQGGVGANRLCVSDKGIIKQNILEWKPEELLAFEMKETDIYFGPCVESIIENFQLTTAPKGGTILTRTTVFKLSKNKLLLTPTLAIGLKSIHNYVFKNWKKLSEEN